MAVLLTYVLVQTGNANCESVRRLTFHTATDWCPIWSLDGSTIVFCSARIQGSNIWRMPASGESLSAAVRLSNHPSSNCDAWVADELPTNTGETSWGALKRHSRR
ncbi:MAG: PD40 domain-containing protein [Candidatus Eiseniibacteriota bacterium]|nr:MAG: PD40 domain-containing protein [Candidatus Eisenbacteria bacterium]